MTAQARWLLVGLLFLATLLNYLDRQTLAVSASRVLADMGLDDRHFGRWLFAFFLAYGLAQMAIGPLLDRSRVVWIVPLASRTQSLDAITGVMCLATFGLGAFMANYLAFSSEVSTTRVSTVTGMLGGAGALAGALFMWIVGDTVAGSGGFAAAFWMAGCMPLVALTGLLLATWTHEVAGASRPSVVLSTGDPS